jgi:hypothetical protein
MDATSSQIFPFDSWTVVNDGRHNAFTDLITWRGELWLAYVSSPSHFANRQSRVVLLHSPDGRTWKDAVRFDGRGQDIRDPKLAVIHDRLTVYALLNRSFDPLPYKTVRADSADGENWSALVDAGPEGWLLGKPKSRDGQTWYTPAHHLKKGAAQLLHSIDGVNWEPVSMLREGGGADESAIEFLPDGRLQAVTRIEAGGLFGSEQTGTLISVAEPPYTKWTQSLSTLTRLDGPTLFSVEGKCYAVGRYQPNTKGWLQGMGSILARKRTSLFRLDSSSLAHLADLPSAGDTAYAGVAILSGNIFISYYTNDPRRDVSWIAGMLSPTMVRVACLLPEALSATKV